VTTRVHGMRNAHANACKDVEPALDPGGGTYVLLLQADISAIITFRRGGSFVAAPGYYAYVGSAFGSGGIRARVLRHARPDKRPHWHIDRLTAVARVTGAMVSYRRTRYEHVWATHLGGARALDAIAGFGCTDCKCYSHLYFTADAAALVAALRGLPGDPRRWVNSLTVAAAAG
jgi:Uri superfamily endonuclease